MSPLCARGNIAAVHSWVPQGSVLGSLLFLIYINDLEDGIASNILKFADDTNIFRRIQTRQESRTLQEDLNILDQCKVTDVIQPK